MNREIPATAELDETDPANWKVSYCVRAPATEDDIEKWRIKLLSVRPAKRLPVDQIDQAAAKAAKEKGGGRLSRDFDTPQSAARFFALAPAGSVVAVVFRRLGAKGRYSVIKDPPRSIRQMAMISEIEGMK